MFAEQLLLPTEPSPHPLTCTFDGYCFPCPLQQLLSGIGFLSFLLKEPVLEDMPSPDPRSFQLSLSYPWLQKHLLLVMAVEGRTRKDFAAVKLTCA